MLIFNKKTNTLEQSDYKYPLVNPKEPNLYRDIFSYGELPKISFNHRRVPMFPPDEIWITDTTFRDGQQARPPYTAEQIVDIYDMLHRLGGPNGVIRQSEFFLYSDKDKKAIQMCLEKGYKYPEITGWIRAHPKDFKLVKDLGLKETGILTSVSDYHIYLKLKLDRKAALDKYLGIVKTALDEGIIPRCHFEDATRADFYGFVVPFAMELMKLSAEYKIPVKIRVCDTMGYGVSYTGADMPRSVAGLMYGLWHLAGVPKAWLEWHGHNDFHKALINGSTAWLYGCAAANGTVLGLGERTGNPPIEALIMEYIMLRGNTNGIDTTVITEIADYFRTEIGHYIPPNQPFVGTDFNTTRAGIHADGLHKNEEIYNIFDTRKILNRPPLIAITDKSGTAGIAGWINNYYNLPEEKQVSKSHQGVLKIKEWVDAEYAANRITAISDKEMVEQVKLYLPELLAE